ncbi:MAG: helix-turn-helix transcriptional regulator [Oscillospiraceae bacterium]
MDSSIGLRIREVRNRFGLSQTEFGKRLDVSRDVINNLELSRLKKDPGALLRLICKTYNVNYGWLMNGEGEMIAPDASQDSSRIKIAKPLEGRKMKLQKVSPSSPPHLARKTGRP